MVHRDLFLGIDSAEAAEAAKAVAEGTSGRKVGSGDVRLSATGGFDYSSVHKVGGYKGSIGLLCCLRLSMLSFA